MGMSQEGCERPEEVRELFSGGKDDDFTRQLNQAVEKIETFCEPWLR